MVAPTSASPFTSTIPPLSSVAATSPTGKPALPAKPTPSDTSAKEEFITASGTLSTAPHQTIASCSSACPSTPQRLTSSPEELKLSAQAFITSLKHPSSDDDAEDYLYVPSNSDSSSLEKDLHPLIFSKNDDGNTQLRLTQSQVALFNDFMFDHNLTGIFTLASWWPFSFYAIEKNQATEPSYL